MPKTTLKTAPKNHQFLNRFCPHFEAQTDIFVEQLKIYPKPMFSLSKRTFVHSGQTPWFHFKNGLKIFIKIHVKYQSQNDTKYISKSYPKSCILMYLWSSKNCCFESIHNVTKTYVLLTQRQDFTMLAEVRVPSKNV